MRPPLRQGQTRSSQTSVEDSHDEDDETSKMDQYYGIPTLSQSLAAAVLKPGTLDSRIPSPFSSQPTFTSSQESVASDVQAKLLGPCSQDTSWMIEDSSGFGSQDTRMKHTPMLEVLKTKDISRSSLTEDILEFYERRNDDLDMDYADDDEKEQTEDNGQVLETDKKITDTQHEKKVVKSKTPGQRRKRKRITMQKAKSSGTKAPKKEDKDDVCKHENYELMVEYAVAEEKSKQTNNEAVEAKAMAKTPRERKSRITKPKAKSTCTTEPKTEEKDDYVCKNEDDKPVVKVAAPKKKSRKTKDEVKEQNALAAARYRAAKKKREEDMLQEREDARKEKMKLEGQIKLKINARDLFLQKVYDRGDEYRKLLPEWANDEYFDRLATK